MSYNTYLGGSSFIFREYGTRHVFWSKANKIFRYAGVFLLKAIFLNAVASSERRSTVRLLRRLIVCLAGTSSDVNQFRLKSLPTSCLLPFVNSHIIMQSGMQDYLTVYCERFHEAKMVSIPVHRKITSIFHSR